MYRIGNHIYRWCETDELLCCGRVRQGLFDKHYLDIEPAYREAGWKVKFESPDYTESFPSYFVFSQK